MANCSPWPVFQECIVRSNPSATRLALSALLVASLVAAVAVADPAPSVLPTPSPQPQSEPPPPPAPGPEASPSPAPGNPADGTWREFDLLQVSGALATYDAKQNRLFSLGGSRASNWALPLAPGCGCDWQPLPAPSSPIRADRYHSAVDPATGLVYSLEWRGNTLEVHTLDPATGTVTVLTPGGSVPFLRYDESAVAFDAVGRRLIVVGAGYGDETGVWALDLLPTPTWTEWDVAGIRLFAGPEQNIVVDPVRRRLLIPDPFLWRPDSLMFLALSLDGPHQWLLIPTGGQLPQYRNPNPYVYDAVTDRVWTIDGQGQPYSLSLETSLWTREPTVGAGPSPRWDAGVAIDPVRHRLLVSGGYDPSLFIERSGAWSLLLDGSGTWTQVMAEAQRPPSLYGADGAFDARHSRLLLFGFRTNGTEPEEVWALDLTASPRWSFIATTPPGPPAGYGHASAWDEARDQLVVSGRSGLFGTFMDVWTLSLAGSPTWTAVAPAGEAPPPRNDHSLVYDRERDRFLMLFGNDGTRDVTDVWELRLAPSPAWRRLATGGVGPTAGERAMCVVDSKRDRLLAFGNGGRPEIWTLDLEHGDGAWTRVPVPPGPSWRSGGLLRLDTLRDRLVLFGGHGPDPSGRAGYLVDLNDTWALNLSGSPVWQRLSPAGVLPRGQFDAAGAYDPVLDRLVGAGTRRWNDLLALGFGAVPTSLRAADRTVTASLVRLTWADAPPGARFTAYRSETGAPKADWLPLGTVSASAKGWVTLEDREITPRAAYGYRLGTLGGANELFTETITVRVPAIALGLSLRARGEKGRAIFALELPSSDPARLELFDLAGRSVWSRSVGSLGAGRHEISAEDGTLPSALYFARLAQGAEVRFARVMVVR
jgi:hypothetical protein